MITKYGYRVTNQHDVVTLEAWGFSTEEEARKDYSFYHINAEVTQMALFETTHKRSGNQHGSQFKQVACKRIN